MTATPICIVLPIILVIGLLVFVLNNKRRTLYVFIPANVDPLDEGVDGWRGLALKTRAERTKRGLIRWAIASAILLMGAALYQPVQIVYAALQPTLTPTLTATPTITPSPTRQPEPTRVPNTPTPRVIYIIITPEATP
jgi:hypothetical protein